MLMRYLNLILGYIKGWMFFWKGELDGKRGVE